MATPDTLVTAVRHALLRTAAGSLVGLALGALVLGLALGPGLWHDVALGGQSLSTAWDLGRSEQTDGHRSTAGQRLERRVSRLSKRHDCRREGFGTDVIPASAVVKVRGQVRTVSFDEGWAMHRGERPGRLLAVCRT